jgi:branched-chain amino acid aminotransferase
MSGHRFGKVNIGGEIVDPGDAKISIFDRGFLYGDSVFETMRVYDSVPFAFTEHLERLYCSAERIGFELPWEIDFIRGQCLDTLKASGLSDSYLRLIATRGSGTMGLDPSLASDPQLVVLALSLPPLPLELYEKGHTAALVGVRRNLKMAIDPQAKTGNYINSVMAQNEARQRGADEAIMLDNEGRVAEGSSANVFAFVGGIWCTPPLDVGILGGITRSTILRIMESAKLPVDVRILWPEELKRASEIFLCSSVREMIPIVELDEQNVGAGDVGKGYQEIHALYQLEVDRQVQCGGE